MDTISRESLSSLFPVFRKAPAGLAEGIIEAGRVTRAGAGSTLQVEGRSCTGLGLVLSGEKRVFRTGPSGREITLYEVGPGEICILEACSVLSGQPCPASAQAMTDLEMLRLGGAELNRLLARYEELRRFFFSLVGQRFTAVADLVTEVAFRNLDQRLIDYLVEKSEDGRLAATHQKVANDLGTAREVVSRLLKELERQGALELSRGSILIRDLKTLSFRPD